MLIKDIIGYLESKAPSFLQESYDNSGLIVGDKNQECTGVLVCLDSIELIVDEAVQKGCNLIVAHHPIVFSGLKSLTGKNYIERTIIKAIKHDISIYAIHTNLDNVFQGVNNKIAQKLGLENISILNSKSQISSKIVVFVPTTKVRDVKLALSSVGAGEIGHYDSCSFRSEGIGSFKAKKGASPHVGQIDELHEEHETKLEMIIQNDLLQAGIRKMLEAHPYEEVAYDIIKLENEAPYIGSGMIGELKKAISPSDFMDHLKSSMQVPLIRHTRFDKKIKRVAVCGGSGSFLLNAAKRKNADVFITSDYKYHQFFDAEDDLMICDIGHYESEQFTIELLVAWLTEKFPKFAVHFTEYSTNPINYY